MDLSATPGKPQPADITDDDRHLLETIRLRFYLLTRAVDGLLTRDRPPLFTTATDGLWTTFLNALPAPLRPIYTCTACRHFVERYGGLVVIDPDGITHSALWEGAALPDSPFSGALTALKDRVESHRVTGVFYSERATLGTPVTGPWEHFSAPTHGVYAPTRKTQSAGQAMAEKQEEYAMLHRGLIEYPLPVARTAAHLITTSDRLARSEKVHGVAEWFLDLHEVRARTTHHYRRDNLVWRAIATAPVGFAHIKNTVIGTLMDDLALGLDFADIQRKFNAKMGGLVYQRPQAAPTTGQINRAETLVRELGLAPSLRRRFARLEEVPSLWTPAIPTEPIPSNNVFDHLRLQAVTPRNVEAPAASITWARFQRDVLPHAYTIECFVPSDNVPFISLTTAADPDAPPILQWDSHVRRNPAAWYVYHRGAMAAHFNLTPRTWVPVTTICLLPSQWYLSEPVPHWGEGIVFLLRGCRDIQKSNNPGGGFFPETLRAELREVRATLEAHVKQALIEGAAEATACGADFRKGSEYAWRLRVSTPLGRAEYTLDRWE